ncbi:uncharacterized protein PITG_00107 [Phytophthora infestans T30-4]|uniref:phospholipase D n=1 Tax=Phytophthora infestans (strain T30-4) TaxID=403677 RepID=D0MSW5_PHYIT|nr:uncharacterized protein PITG_00107 [Phytophthora infestans T30-4]EEY57549.1 conserved hypothetical protein [Phytophthora infestans T30-4]|eukprot:XP_002908735.1 conserved hypothetical protein [Phytophthora infestans T30-4]
MPCIAPDFLWGLIISTPLTIFTSIRYRVFLSQQSRLEGVIDNRTLTYEDNVQIVRTFICQYKHYDEFAPQGENTLFQALIKALKNAKNFIYIEDQYFILVPELLDASGGYEKYLFDMIAPIQKLYPNKFQIYTTKSSLNLYIHTKLVIIDDVFVTVSSANWNRRSMTSDSEMAANIIDEDSVDSPDGVTVLRTARDFRIRKFHEMTGLSYDELDAMTIIEAANQLDTAAADKSSIIEAFLQ